MKLISVLLVGILCFLAGCGEKGASGPERFYRSYLQAWADSNFDKVISMHYTNKGDYDFSYDRIKTGIRRWAKKTGDKTPMSVCRRTLRAMDGVVFIRNDENLKTLDAVKGKGPSAERLGPCMTILLVEGEWKVQNVSDVSGSKQDWTLF